jgi:hypothetical protein
MAFYPPPDADGVVSLDPESPWVWRHDVIHQEGSAYGPGKVRTAYLLTRADRREDCVFVIWTLEFDPFDPEADNGWVEASRVVDEGEIRKAGVRIPGGLIRQSLTGGRPINSTPMRRCILEAVATAGSRLTRSEVFSVLRESKPDFSENTLRIELAKLVDAQWLDNDQEARPRGYGITRLGRSILKKGDD